MKATNKYNATIYGHIPSKSNCYKIGVLNGHGTLVKQKKLKEYENTFVGQCVGRRSPSNPLIKGFFHLWVDVYLPNKTQDLDNCLKILLDLLQTCGIIKNDCKCLHIDATRYEDKKNPRVTFEIEEVFGGDEPEADASGTVALA